MKLMRAATLSVADLHRSFELYTHWLGYCAEETGAMDASTAASRGSPKSAGARTAVLRPASGHDVVLRFV